MGEVTCALEELNKTISKILINATPKGKELVFSE